MKVVCNRDVLLEAVQAVQQAVAGRTPRPILQCIKIETQKEKMTLMATDQEESIRFDITQLDVGEPGTALVGAERLSGIVRETLDKTLKLELIENTLHIRGHCCHFQIFSQDPKDFPQVPEFEGDVEFSLPAGTLRKLLHRTQFAMAHTSTRYAINGALWERKGQRLQIVATDGKRLALAKAAVTRKTEQDASSLVPAKAMSIIEKNLLSDDVKADVAISERQIFLQIGPAMICANLLEGHFPRYEEVLPKGCDKKVEIAIGDFGSAVRQAALLTDETSHGVSMALGKDEMVMTGRSSEQGEATINVPVAYEGEEFKIGFNPQFLIEAMRVVAGEEEKLVMELKAPDKPGMFRVGPDLTYVVMPVSLQ